MKWLLFYNYTKLLSHLKIYSIKLNRFTSLSQTLFFTINGKMISSSQLLLEIYDNEKDKDGFLYITYTSENTFG